MMRRALLNPKFSINHLLTPTPRSSSTPIPNTQISPSFSYPSKFRFFSALNQNPFTEKPSPNTESTTISHPPPKDFKFQDVSSNKGETDQVSSVEPGGTSFGGKHRLFPQTDPDMMREAMNLLNNPVILRDMVMSNPQLRELFDRIPEIRQNINDLPIDKRMELLRNPERLLEILGRPETTTASPAPSTDPLPNPLAAAAASSGTDNATNPTPYGGVDDVSNSGTVTVNVRLLNGKKFIIGASLNASVEALKSVVEQKCDVPAGEQRLVYKGRVLYDDDHETLKTYGLEADDTVHLIRGSGGLSWFQRTPSPLLGPRAHIIQAMHDSNPEFSKMINNPEFKSMFPNPMSIEQLMTLTETVFSDFTRGPVPPEEKYAIQLAQLEEMGFLDTRQNLQALTAHGGDVYATVELLTILSSYH